MRGRGPEAAAFGGMFLFGIGAAGFAVVTLLALRARALSRTG